MNRREFVFLTSVIIISETIIPNIITKKFQKGDIIRHKNQHEYDYIVVNTEGKFSTISPFFGSINPHDTYGSLYMFEESDFYLIMK